MQAEWMASQFLPVKGCKGNVKGCFSLDLTGFENLLGLEIGQLRFLERKLLAKFRLQIKVHRYIKNW